MSNRTDFAVRAWAITAPAWLGAPTLLGFMDGVIALAVGISGLALVVYRVRVARLDLKLKQAEAAARGIEL